MSKVVHLSNEAHTRAKLHCQRAGLKMSEWVAALIEAATQAQPPVAPTQGGQQDKASPEGAHTAAPSASREADAASAAGASAAPYAAPPFWAHRAAGAGPSAAGMQAATATH